MQIGIQETCGNHDDKEYDHFIELIQLRFDKNVTSNEAVFNTDADDLWNIYLNSFPSDQRQYHNCHACRQFIKRFGSLAIIDETGRTSPAFWDEADAPKLYLNATRRLARAVKKAKITGPFLSKDSIWGDPVTGEWKHFALKAPKNMLHKDFILTAGQAMAAKKEDFGAVCRALAEFPMSAIQQALKLLRSDSLYRSEKVLGQAEWLHHLHMARHGLKGKARDNVVWKAIASAPAGFCHPRSSMIGTLLEDILGGMKFDEVSRRFKDKMHPLQYQRPQAAPTKGNIEQAEKIVEKLGIASSLCRRFALVEELQSIWKPQVEPETEKPGVFGHLKHKGKVEAEVVGSPISITWDKFRRIVLPHAKSISFYVPHGRNGYAAILTAVDPESKPILQWDSEEDRNPFSWYVWHGGSTPQNWGLPAGSFVNVNAISYKPSMWNEGHDQQGNGVVFILEGAREYNFNAGMAIFPETLKAELHGIRATIEAFSKAGKLEGAESASACGIALMAGGTWDSIFKVKTDLGITEYRLDRWD